jgi:hypothetical protein
MREAYAAERQPFARLAERFGVTEFTTLCAVRGKTWPDAGGPIDRGKSSMRGGDHPRARLTDDQAAAIRRLHAEGGWTHQALAEKYGVSRENVTRLLNRKTYGPGPPVVLDGPGEPPTVRGKALGRPLPPKWYKVLKALADAYPGGLTGDELVIKSGVTSAAKIARKMADEPDLARTVRCPGTTRGGLFRLTWPDDESINVESTQSTGKTP